MEIQVGQPQIEGRYVIFVQCQNARISEWCQPEIATWHVGRWHTRKAVYGWIGPLPLAKVQPLLDAHFSAKRPQPEYDL